MTGSVPEKVLQMLARVLDESHDVESLLAGALEVLVEAVRAERGFVVLRDETGGLEIAASRNIDREEVRSPKEKVSSSVVQEVLRTGAPVVTPTGFEDPRFAESASLKRIKTLSILCVPISRAGRTIGVIYLDNRFLERLFEEQHLQLAYTFAERIAAPLEQMIRMRVLRSEAERRQRMLEGRYRYDRIIGRSPRMQEVFRLLDKVIPTNLPVLIQGESGTGKELVARAIHFNGPRKAGPFVAENCGAITGSLLESELFGHVKGAFTGADRDRPGLLEQAHGGTLFLDEISAMPLDMQRTLLRTIETGELRRVGDTQTRKVDARIIAASNEPLAEQVRKGTFREDLYYRLKVVVIELPPLRERAEDIPLLVEHFLTTWAHEQGRAPWRLGERALRVLMRHPWPGNVRQLENELKRATLLADDEIEVEHLSLDVVRESRQAAQLRPAGSLRDAERSAVLAALERAGWNKKEAARLLGIPRTTLYSKMRQLGIPDSPPAGG